MKLFTPRKIKITAITLTSIFLLFAVAISMPWCGILKGNIRYLENLPRPLIYLHLGKPFRIREVSSEDRKGYLERRQIPVSKFVATEYQVEVQYWDVSGFPWNSEGYRIYLTYLKLGSKCDLIGTHCNPIHPH